jgi:hypothetical protein
MGRVLFAIVAGALILSGRPHGLAVADPARAAALDPELVKNRDARAFPRGLYFHSSVPIERRQVLIEDLAWLASAGPLKASGELANLLAMKRQPLSGAMLVAWLIERIAIVSAQPAALTGHHGHPVILSGARPDLGVLVFGGRWGPQTPGPRQQAGLEEVGPVSDFRRIRLRREANYSWRNADTAQKELDGWHIDDRVLIAASDAYANHAGNDAIIYLTEPFWREYRDQTPHHRIMRLAILFHEARHLDGWRSGDIDSHFPCEEDAWPRATQGLRLSGASLPTYQPIVGCNWHHASAYGIGAAFIRAVSQNCPACAPADLMALKSQEVLAWSSVQLRLRTPVRMPVIPALHDEKGWAGLTVTTVPPQVYFTARREQTTLYESRWKGLLDQYAANKSGPWPWWNEWREQITALSAWIIELDRQRFIDPGRSLSRWSKVANDDPSSERRQRPEPGEQNAVDWIMAATKAKGEGFNLPLVWMPPCKTFNGGCSADTDAAPSQPAPLPQTTPGWIGATVVKVISHPFLDGPHGVGVERVEKNSPAAKAGFEADDVILEVDGQPVADVTSLKKIIAEAGAGATLELAYAGYNTVGYRNVTLAEKPAASAADVSVPPVASGEVTIQPVAGRWMHNGSIMELVADGAVRKFLYTEPREGMRRQGVTPGTLLFEGRKDGDRYSGTAFIFSKRCGRFFYEVSGEVTEGQRRVIVRGQAPRLNAKCNVTSHRDDELVFDYIGAAPAQALAGAKFEAAPVSGHRAEPRSYRIKPDVSSGYLNMRSGPGQNHQVVAAIPAGSDGVMLDSCRPPEDDKSRGEWCRVTWRDHSGWISRSGMVEE